MRTSSSQFEMMVTYMEQHGDLSKPNKNVRGRIESLRHWDELAQLLNSDGSGDCKTVEKWKKVWSDCKNNTKKKAARLHRAASGTGGGPATLARLSELEQRIIHIMGEQVATGLAVGEVGLPQNLSHYSSDETRVLVPPPQGTLTQPLQLRSVEGVSVLLQDNEQGSLSLTNRTLPSPTASEDVQVPSSQPWPSTSGMAQTQSPHQSTQSPPQSRPPLPISVQIQAEDEIFVPPLPSSQGNTAQEGPSHSGETTPRRTRPRRTRGSPLRRVRHGHIDQAAQHFLQSDENWRQFKMQQHKDYVELRRDQNRIREIEIEAQRRWESLGERALGLIERVVNKFCTD